MRKLVQLTVASLCLTFIGCLPSPEDIEEHGDRTASDSESAYENPESEENNETDRYESGPTLSFHETFLNNSNNWFEDDDMDVKAEIRGGSYYFEHKRVSDNSYITVQNRGMSPTSDFSIETSITYISGKGEDTNFGLIFGHDYDGNSGFKFLISNDGEYEVSGVDDGNYYVIQEPTQTYSLNQGEETNLLRVTRDGEFFTFYINGTQVYSMEAERLPGQHVGFQLYWNVAIEIDDLKIFS